MNLAVNNTSLFLAAMLVLVALGISLWQKLGLDRDIVIGVVRAVVQLFIVGYLLKYIFRVNNLANAGDDGLHYLQCGLECEKTGAGD